LLFKLFYSFILLYSAIWISFSSNFIFFLPFMIYKVSFVFLYLCGVYLILLLLKYYDNCTRIETQQTNETLDWYSKISNIIDELLEIFTTPSNLSITDVYNYISSVCLKLIDILEGIRKFFDIHGDMDLIDILVIFIDIACIIILIPLFFYWLLFNDSFFHEVFNKDTNNKSPSNNQCKGFRSTT